MTPRPSSRSRPIIRAMQPTDADAVIDIYAQGIASGHATFANRAPAWGQWDETHHAHCRLVAENLGVVMGWAALAPVSKRDCYRGVAEVSIYVAKVAAGRGVGTALMQALVKASEQAGIWTLHSSIFPENEASVALHQSAGFRIIGNREKIARMPLGPMAGKWRDVVLMERRSGKAGID